MEQEQHAGLVDFAKAKAVRFEVALERLGLLDRLRRKSDELVGVCPLHGGDKESFGVNVVKQVFKCFGCGKSGKVLDFVRLYQNVAVKEAAQWLVDMAAEGEREDTPQVAEPEVSALTERERVLVQAVGAAVMRRLAVLLRAWAGELDAQASTLADDENVSGSSR